jgi:thiamine-monophosphate kinase
MIDISDGIATDAGHLARASEARLRVDVRALPLAEGLEEVCSALGEPPWRIAAAGGEDYELCFCAAPEDRAAIERALRELGQAQVSWIGEVLEGAPGVELLAEGGQQVRLEGFEHRW